MITYNDIATRFPEFATDDTNKQDAIASLISSAQREISAEIWGELAVEGLYYLVACKLARNLTSSLYFSQLKIEQEKTQNTNSLPSLSSAQRIAIEGEYSVEFKSSEGSSLISGKSSFSELMGKNCSNIYCEEYERLLNLVSSTPIYSD